jgi:hypothetical protein
VFSISVVPTGLVLNLMHNPGTEVPGYFHLVPTGRTIAKLLLRPFRDAQSSSTTCVTSETQNRRPPGVSR